MATKNKDTLFQEKRAAVAPLTFDAEVASVFDDMISRSVPGYEEVIAREAQLAAAHYISGTRIYDLGCSTGNLESALGREPSLRHAAVIAVDNAPAMLQAFAGRGPVAAVGPHIHPLCMDIRDVSIKNARWW
jgi:tRNA (cmo5U34)-methyltransferase